MVRRPARRARAQSLESSYPFRIPSLRQAARTALVTLTLQWVCGVVVGCGVGPDGAPEPGRRWPLVSERGASVASTCPPIGAVGCVAVVRGWGVPVGVGVAAGAVVAGRLAGGAAVMPPWLAWVTRATAKSVMPAPSTIGPPCSLTCFSAVMINLWPSGKRRRTRERHRSRFERGREAKSCCRNFCLCRRLRVV